MTYVVEQFAQRAFQHGGVGQRGAGVRRRAGPEPRDLLVGQVLALEVGGLRYGPEAAVPVELCPERVRPLPPGRDERLAVGGHAGVHEDDAAQPVAEARGGLAHGNARVAVADEDDIAQAEPLHLLDDVAHMGL